MASTWTGHSKSQPGQDTSSLSNFLVSWATRKTRWEDKRWERESADGYRAVLREYHSQWMVETRTSPYLLSKFSQRFLFRSKWALHHVAKLCTNLPHPVPHFVYYSGGRFGDRKAIFLCVAFIYLLLPFLSNQHLPTWWLINTLRYICIPFSRPMYLFNFYLRSVSTLFTLWEISSQVSVTFYCTSG